MITRIKIKNINAIKECDLSFEKARYHYLNDMVFDDVVSPVALYGANGSGKSSFLKAISQLISLLIDEPDQLNGFMPNVYRFKKVEEECTRLKEEDVPDELLKKAIEVVHSSIEFVFTLDGYVYNYYIETSISKITKEFLRCNEKEVFSRGNNKYTYNNSTFEMESELYPVLRKLANDEQIGNADIDNAYNYLSRMAFVDDSQKRYQFKGAVEKSYMDFVVSKSNEVKQILANYKDFPLYEVTSKINPEQGQKQYFATIDMGDESFDLPYTLLSSGMKNQSALLSVLLMLPEYSAMFVDEIEDALHPLTIMNFISVAREKHIQLFFSSHNTYILSKLRPDQVFFTGWKKGYSRYKRLSDIYPNIREVNNIEKMYLGCMFDEEINAED